ncbi:integrase arm-type DNA-binding domain-containing protein [Mesorhizobium sp. LHD-90]|uniref:tyrosine-type recombinase/integrase n=1 Tax=Mesorhizobium sp. LHD-90 TaxID=3071414 RepID=UPI0027E0CB02|nr:integrase arm-type DNA-binding domain-containing protein [Mesorhizobium sp. LHD-90]MDQ6437184.1 integrase arm-type DNA-binding domain-containing protein [Mesorhizobium sp. LHD-90]
MARRKLAEPLTAKVIDALTTTRRSERFPEGTVSCLYMKVQRSGSKSWVFWTERKGFAGELGLGSWTGAGKAGRVSIHQARKAALAIHDRIGSGHNPVEERRRDSITFGKVAADLIAEMTPGWGEKSVKNWKLSLQVHAADLRSKPVAKIGVDDVLAVLRPYWTEKLETAKRLRQRIEHVLDFAKAKGHRDGDNPAAWKGGLQKLLPNGKRATRHFAAAPYAAIPGIVTALNGMAGQADDETGVKALLLTLHCVTRTGETLKAEWQEFELDGEEPVWTVPAARTKMRKDHRIPLNPAALALLDSLPRKDGETRLFPDTNSHTMLNVLQSLPGCGDHTVHGTARSGFRDWAGNETSFPRDLIEECLAHAVGDNTERAYRRGEAMAKRRKLLAAWSGYLDGGSNVRQLRRA